MFKKYRSTVEYKSLAQPLMVDDNYKKIVDEVLYVNKNSDKQSKKFESIISNFPRIRIDNNCEGSIIKLKKNIIGMLAADICVNDRKMTFIIDTGAEVTVLTDAALANACIKKKAEERIEIGSCNNKMDEMGIALADKIMIGNVKVFNLPVLVMYEKQLSFSIFGYNIFKFDGILGWDILSQLDFEIDYRKSEFRIIKQSKDGYIPNLIKSSFPALLIVDEHNMLRVFGLDTGARRSWICERLVEKAGLNIVKKKEQKVLGVHGKEKTVVNVVKDYKIRVYDALISFKNISTGFTGFLNNFEFDGVLGIDILKDNTLKVINSKGIIQLENKSICFVH